MVLRLKLFSATHILLIHLDFLQRTSLARFGLLLGSILSYYYSSCSEVYLTMNLNLVMEVVALTWSELDFTPLWRAALLGHSHANCWPTAHSPGGGGGGARYHPPKPAFYHCYLQV